MPEVAELVVIKVRGAAKRVRCRLANLGSDNRQMKSETSAQKEIGHTTGFEVKPTSDSHFAWIRTRLSTDSTLMGWMRNAY
jgi:hypothetical protein